MNKGIGQTERLRDIAASESPINAQMDTYGRVHQLMAKMEYKYGSRNTINGILGRKKKGKRIRNDEADGMMERPQVNPSNERNI